jgi:hypothetical protein
MSAITKREGLLVEIIRAKSLPPSYLNSDVIGTTVIFVDSDNNIPCLERIFEEINDRFKITPNVNPMDMDSITEVLKVTYASKNKVLIVAPITNTEPTPKEIGKRRTNYIKAVFNHVYKSPRLRLYGNPGLAPIINSSRISEVNDVTLRDFTDDLSLEDIIF